MNMVECLWWGIDRTLCQHSVWLAPPVWKMYGLSTPVHPTTWLPMKSDFVSCERLIDLVMWKLGMTLFTPFAMSAMSQHYQHWLFRVWHTNFLILHSGLHHACPNITHPNSNLATPIYWRLHNSIKVLIKRTLVQSLPWSHSFQSVSHGR